MTLFEKVTKSPEALTEFICSVVDRCADDDLSSCLDCPFYDEAHNRFCDNNGIISKLNEELDKPKVVTIEVTDDMTMFDIVKALHEVLTDDSRRE